MADLSQYLDDVRLPTMPEVAQELIQSLNADDVPFERVRKAISRDQGLTAKLLRLANSARFGLARKVSSVDEAITLLGLNQVRTLALAACINDSFPISSGIDRKQFWTESLACAGYAQWLARSLGVDAQLSWLTGFMARLGELIIAQKSPQHLGAIEQLPHHPGGRWEREQALLGFTEGEVTAQLAQRWNFPEAMVAALQAESDPMAAKPFNRLGAMIHIATLLAEIAVEEHKSVEDTIESLPAEVLQALQLEKAWLKLHLPAVETLIDPEFSS